MSKNGAVNGQGQWQTHVLSVLVQNQPGVLAHIAGMFAARGYNIDSLVVGRTEEPAFSRIVLVTSGDESTLEQIRKQLGKIVPVVKIRDLTEQDCVERDLILIHVHCPPEKRTELRQLTEVFRGSIVDIGLRSVIIQLTGPEAKVEAFIELCRPYGIRQLARTGVIAMPRDSATGRQRRDQRGAAAKARAAAPTVPLPPS
jgi:acetolactate synthase-1/3 small subunit